MTTTTKRGRRTKPHRTTWGETIDGLYRRPGTNQWRIVATGREFREHDERAAVARFREWERAEKVGMVTLHTTHDDPATKASITAALTAQEPFTFIFAADPEGTGLRRDVPEAMLWSWLRKQLIDRPHYVAERVGIPQIASLRDMPMPKDSVRLSALIESYEKHNKSLALSKAKVRYAWDEFVKVTGAITLRELTTDMLLAYADKMNSSGHGANYVHDKFNRVKRVIAYGRKRGFDANEIRGVLDRAEVLVSADVPPEADPTPITRDDFRKLLDAANDFDRAALLISLNCCMYISEFLSLDWEEIDWKTGTYLSRRNKTGITRAAVLWTRTLDALKKLPQTPGAIFKSSRGDRYHPNSYRKKFRTLRESVKLDDVEHNHIRDGSYTAAASKAVGLHLAQVLAGHAQNGETDKYVRRNPEMVRPACEAVEKHYFA